MKSLIILAFSALLCLFGCDSKHRVEKVSEKQLKEVVKEITQTKDSGLNLSYVNENQNGVFDTSSTSVQSAVAEAQMFAKQLDESTYQASLLQDRINQKLKKLIKVSEKLDSSISQTEKTYDIVVKNHRRELDKYVASNQE